MINDADYILETENEDRTITIKPVIQTVLNDVQYATGVFGLSEGVVGMGEIVFDDQMDQWEYTGMGDLTHEQAEEIARFIKQAP